MNLSQLYYFCKLAELQHYTKASKELYVTQPTLSESISLLEEELEVKLFQKEGRNIKLTKEGAEFNISVNAALSELERGIAQIKQSSGRITGTLNIGCIPTLMGEFLPRVTNEFSEKNPDININVYTGYTNEIVNAILQGKQDVGFCSKDEEQTDLMFVPVMPQHIVAIVNDKHPLANAQQVTFEDLKKYRSLTYRESVPIGKSIKKTIEPHGLIARYCYDDEISICGMVSVSSNVGIVTHTAPLKQFANLSILKIVDFPADFRYVHLVYNKKSRISSALEVFINHIALNEIKE